jgi:hypothetical protein
MIVTDSYSDGVTIRIEGGRGEINEIIVQKKNAPMRLEDRCYQRYQIIKPTGYEDQEIFHCPDRGLAVLLSVVFMTLAAPIKRLPACDMRA